MHKITLENKFKEELEYLIQKVNKIKLDHRNKNNKYGIVEKVKREILFFEMM